MRHASEAHARSIALMKFLSGIARRLGVAEHVYVVGGAVRNWLIDKPIKDIDVVLDSVALGKDSNWFAQEVAKAIPTKTTLKTNNYGVAILAVSPDWVLDGHKMLGELNTEGKPIGEKIEIANARKESYGGAEGKGYKPHLVEPATIEEDVFRREFTFNTLLWRLLDLEHGPEKAEVIDLTGLGRKHLEERLLITPVDPDKTFSDDPSRMLRAIKFIAKFGFKIPPDVLASIRRNAEGLKRMPWDHVRKILVEDILGGPAPRRSVELMKELGLDTVVKEILHVNKEFVTALSGGLSKADIHLLLDLLDLGWVFRTPIGFLDRAGQIRLREILLSNAEDPAFEKDFVAAIQKPPVEQERLFAEFAIPMKERGVVVQIARRLLLAEPDLVRHGLADAVEAEIAQRYAKASLPERVAKRFLLR